MRRLLLTDFASILSVLVAGCLAAVALLATASAASAVTYRPTRTDDPPPDGCKKKDCSLREAVIAADATPIHTVVTIVLRPGRTYRLTRPGPNEGAAATGDLDLTGPNTIVKTKGRGARAIIDGDGLDRIFDVGGPFSRY